MCSLKFAPVPIFPGVSMGSGNTGKLKTCPHAPDAEEPVGGTRRSW